MIKLCKKTIIGVAVTVLIVVCAATVYFITKHQEKETSSEELLVSKIKEALAAEKNVSENCIEIYFYKQTQDTNIYATGAVISGENSVVFLYNSSNHKITDIEVDYTALTDEEHQAFTIILEKGYRKNPENKIVPCDLTNVTGGGYDFKYYDGWYIHWSFGYATVYLHNQTILYNYHVRD